MHVDAGKIAVLPAKGAAGDYARHIYGSRSLLTESAFRRVLYLSGISVLLLLSAIFVTLFIASGPAIKQQGLAFAETQYLSGPLPFLCFKHRKPYSTEIPVGRDPVIQFLGQRIRRRPGARTRGNL